MRSQEKDIDIVNTTATRGNLEVGSCSMLLGFAYMAGYTLFEREALLAEYRSFSGANERMHGFSDVLEWNMLDNDKKWLIREEKLLDFKEFLESKTKY